MRPVGSTTRVAAARLVAGARRLAAAGVGSVNPAPIGLDALYARAGEPARRRVDTLLEAWDGPSQADSGPLARVLDIVTSGGDRGRWLTLAVLTGELPVAEAVQRLRNAVRLDDAAATLADELRIHWLRPAPWPRVEVTRDVLVDLHTTSQTPLATGIQRVARELGRRWVQRHGAMAVTWTASGALVPLVGDDLSVALSGRPMPRLSLGELDEYEVVKLIADESGATEDVRGRDVPVLVPFGATYLLPEVMTEPYRYTRLLALARFSGNTTGAIGFDCVPITMADTTRTGVSQNFVNGLAAVRHMTRVVTISEAAATEYRGWRRMLSGAGWPGPEIDTALLPVVATPPDPQVLDAARQLLVTGTLPMVLCVGTHEPRKNHVALLHAADLAWRQGARFSLVFVGSHTWGNQDFFDLLNTLQAQRRPVETVTGVDDDMLRAAYCLAHCVAFPSLHEGYGLPAAEALALGTPVITSGYGSMAQIAADGGALLVDPRDDLSIRDALISVVMDHEVVDRLRAEAAARPVRSWDDYAEQAWAMFTRPAAPPQEGVA